MAPSIYRMPLILGATFLAGACGIMDSPGPDPDQHPVLVAPHEFRHGPLRVSLKVSPAALDPPGTVTARLTYMNLGSAVVDVVSGYGCLAFAAVSLDGQRVPFPATQYGCTTAITTRELAPGASLTAEWPLVVGDEDGPATPPGTYRFVAKLNTIGFDLERTFIVR